MGLNLRVKQGMDGQSPMVLRVVAYEKTAPRWAVFGWAAERGTGKKVLKNIKK